VILFTPLTASASCVALSESPKLRAKQGHAKFAKPSSFSSKLHSHPAPTQSGFRTFKPSSIQTLRSSARVTETERSRAAFTLVELLAVVGIMGLLAAVAVPALKGLTGSGGRKQALSQVMGALEIARNTAISTGTNAAVIFPDSGFASGDAYKYRSMAVVSYKDSTIATNTNTSTPFDKLVSSWIVLPQGISFLPKYLSTTTTTNMISVSALIQIPPKTNSTTITCPGIIFQSDGGLLDGSTNSIAGVGFFEGTVDASGKTNPTSKMTSFETVRLTRYTGRTIPTLAPAP
jgi:prepilin-type N-terminal cleavage/methylation domain-containing protein